MVSIDSVEISADLVIRVYVGLEICSFEENIMHQVYVIAFKAQVFQKILDLVDPGIVGSRCFFLPFFCPFIRIGAGKGDAAVPASRAKIIKGF